MDGTSIASKSVANFFDGITSLTGDIILGASNITAEVDDLFLFNKTFTSYDIQRWAQDKDIILNTYNDDSVTPAMKNSTSLVGPNTVDISNSGNWDIGTELTIMFWMHWSDEDNDTGTVFSLGSGINASFQRPLIVNNNTFDQSMITFNVGNEQLIWQNSTASYNNVTENIGNRWQHYGFIIRATSMEIYLDGNLLASKSITISSIPATGNFILGVSELTGSFADELIIFNKAIDNWDVPGWAKEIAGELDFSGENFKIHTSEDVDATKKAKENVLLETTVSKSGYHAFQIITIDFDERIRQEDSSWKSAQPVLKPYARAMCEADDPSLSGVEIYVWTTRTHSWRTLGSFTTDNSFLEDSARFPGLLESITNYLPHYGEVSILILSRGAATNTVELHLSVDYAAAGIILSYETPIWEQFIYWMTSFLSGDDYSFLYKKTSVEVISIFAWETVKLQFAALILSLLIAVPIGVVSATRQYSKIDNISMTAALLGVSLPVFWTGLICILIFAYYFPFFPSRGAYTMGVESSFPDYGTWSIDAAWHMVLPTLILGTASAALITRLVRSSMLEVLRQDYVMTARAKGLTERIVIYKHALRNALLPVVTIIGLSLGGMLGGAALTETVFNWPGLGKTYVWAAINKDYYLVLGINVILSMIMIVANLLTDISYAFLDPRIRY